MNSPPDPPNAATETDLPGPLAPLDDHDPVPTVAEPVNAVLDGSDSPVDAEGFGDPDDEGTFEDVTPNLPVQKYQAIVPSIQGVLDRTEPRNQALSFVPFRKDGDIEAFLTALAQSQPASVPRRPQFCATEGCGNPAAMLEGTDGRYRPGSHCVSCAKKHGTVRTIEKVKGAVERIPKRYRGMTFDSPHVVGRVRPELLELGRKVVDDEVLSIVIAGDSGNGKSILAASMCNYILSKATLGCTPRQLDRASRIYWTNAPALSTARTESKYGREPEIIERATRASFLVIDEFGRETGAEGKDAFWRVLDARHEAHRPTVFMTFLRRDEIMARYDGGYIRRLFEKDHSAIFDLGFKKKKAPAP